MNRMPTEKQYRLLRVLGDGAMVLAPHRREWGPLLRRGWVQPEAEDEDKRFLPPLRITADGLRALADAVETYGLPELNGRPQQLQEAPDVTHLRGKVKEAKEERDQARREQVQAEQVVWQVRRALEQYDTLASNRTRP